MIAYLFLNGELLGDISFYKDYIKQNSGDIFCADGGGNLLEVLGLYPLELWGDLDSIELQTLEKYRKKGTVIKKFPKEKDFTDSELLIQYLVDKYDKIIIIGGLGGRKDHELTNINLIFKYKKLYFLTQREEIFYIPDDMLLKNYKGKIISFIPFSDKVKNLSLKGFQYSLENYTLLRGESRCMSNIIIEDMATINYSSGILLGIITNL